MQGKENSVNRETEYQAHDTSQQIQSLKKVVAGMDAYLEHTYVCLPSNDSITQKCDRLFTKRTQKIVICVTIQVYLLS